MIHKESRLLLLTGKMPKTIYIGDHLIIVRSRYFSYFYPKISILIREVNTLTTKPDGVLGMILGKGRLILSTDNTAYNFKLLSNYKDIKLNGKDKSPI